MFRSEYPYLKICIHDDNTKSRLQPSIQSKINCSHECFINNDIKIDLRTNSCISSCNESSYKYELNNLCYEKCPNTSFLSSDNGYLCLDKSSESGYYLDNNLMYKECYNSCKICNEGGNETNHNCVKCKSGFYSLEDLNNRNCYKDPIGYYLDINESIYKKCYYSCEECDIEGNNITHNCIKCKNNYATNFQANNYFNCFPNCTYYYYFVNYNNYNNYICTNNNECPADLPLIVGKECKISNENKIKNKINDLENEINAKDEIQYYNTILKNVDDILTSNDYVTTNLDKGNDEIIEIDKVKVIFTTNENQKKNIKYI